MRWPSFAAEPRVTERGATIVEFLAVALLTIVSLLTVIQMAAWVWARNVAVSAAHEGARTAAEAGRPLGDGASRTEGLLRDGLGASAARFRVDVAQEGETVAVRASGDAPRIVWFLPVLSIEVQATAFDEDAVLP